MRLFILLTLAALPLAGCTTSREDTTYGGTSDYYDTSNSVGQGEPRPSASPTFRPGMNPEDPRDSHFITRPQPFQQPPATK